MEPITENRRPTRRRAAWTLSASAAPGDASASTRRAATEARRCQRFGSAASSARDGTLACTQRRQVAGGTPRACARQAIARATLRGGPEADRATASNWEAIAGSSNGGGAFRDEGLPAPAERADPETRRPRSADDAGPESSPARAAGRRGDPEAGRRDGDAAGPRRGLAGGAAGRGGGEPDVRRPAPAGQQAGVEALAGVVADRGADRQRGAGAAVSIRSLIDLPLARSPASLARARSCLRPAPSRVPRPSHP